MSVESMNATAASTVSANLVNQRPEISSNAAITTGNNQQASQASSANQATQMSVEEVEAAVEKLNEFMETGQHNLNFSVDKDTENLVVKVMDKSTQEVIRQFPSEETLKLAKHIEGMLGLIFNEEA
jgi:flagellar protein FlaG